MLYVQNESICSDCIFQLKNHFYKYPKNFEKFKVDLVSLMGRTILSKTIIPSSSGTLTIPMNMDKTYASGTYLVRIKGNNTSITKKIILLK